MKNDSSPNVNASAANSEKKTSVYLPGDTLSQIRTEAARLDRSVSWLITRMWAISKDTLAQMPDA